MNKMGLTTVKNHLFILYVVVSCLVGSVRGAREGPGEVQSVRSKHQVGETEITKGGGCVNQRQTRQTTT